MKKGTIQFFLHKKCASVAMRSKFCHVTNSSHRFGTPCISSCIWCGELATAAYTGCYGVRKRTVEARAYMLQLR